MLEAGEQRVSGEPVGIDALVLLGKASLQGGDDASLPGSGWALDESNVRSVKGDVQCQRLPIIRLGEYLTHRPGNRLETPPLTGLHGTAFDEHSDLWHGVRAAANLLPRGLASRDP